MNFKTFKDLEFKNVKDGWDSVPSKTNAIKAEMTFANGHTIKVFGGGYYKGDGVEDFEVDVWAGKMLVKSYTHKYKEEIDKMMIQIQKNPVQV
jgi:hypothetical protein